MSSMKDHLPSPPQPPQPPQPQPQQQQPKSPLTTTTAPTQNNVMSCHHELVVIATRLHLGQSSKPPSTETIQGNLQNLYDMAQKANIPNVLIAVDATPKLPNYDHVEQVKSLVQQLLEKQQQEQEAQAPVHHTENDSSATRSTTITTNPKIHIIPVTPWGKFVPALNALVSFAKMTLDAKYIMFVSAEVSVSCQGIQTLLHHHHDNNKEDEEDSSVLVTGAVCNGHWYKEKQHQLQKSTTAETNSSSSGSGGSGSDSGSTCFMELNGRTCPWNTCAIWNVSKLSMTGFLLVSDVAPNNAAGIEECVVIGLLQTLYRHACRAKLIWLSKDDMTWNETSFEQDPSRQAWHEQKMNSKVQRAQTQMDLLQVSGIVEHC